MKTFKKIGCIAAVCLLMLGSTSSLTAGAEESGKTHEVEYATEILLPMLSLEEGQSYKVEVYHKTDVDFERPLPVNGYSFTPDGIGEYVLRYLLNDNGVESYLYHTMRVQDTVAPTFTLALHSTYAAGTRIPLTPNITDNGGKFCQVSYKLYHGKTNVTDQIVDGVFTPQSAGEYKVRVQVTDGGGNTAAEIFSFTVTDGKTGDGKDKGGCSNAIGGAFGVVAALGVAVACRRKNKEGTR